MPQKRSKPRPGVKRSVDRPAAKPAARAASAHRRRKPVGKSANAHAQHPLPPLPSNHADAPPYDVLNARIDALLQLSNSLQPLLNPLSELAGIMDARGLAFTALKGSTTHMIKWEDQSAKEIQRLGVRTRTATMILQNTAGVARMWEENVGRLAHNLFALADQLNTLIGDLCQTLPPKAPSVTTATPASSSPPVPTVNPSPVTSSLSLAGSSAATPTPPGARIEIPDPDPAHIDQVVAATLGAITTATAPPTLRLAPENPDDTPGANDPRGKH